MAADLVKSKVKEENLMDGMSMLPDELLVMILSYLTLKEAAASSILSRRWRYLWTFIGRLDFGGTELLLKSNIYKNTKLLDEERSKYVKWVNHVIASRNNSAPVHDFKVVFYLNKSHEEQIHEWIRYALERKVQTLELNLRKRQGSWFPMFEQFCSFPYKILQQQQQGIHLKQLRRISLRNVAVSGEALEFLLRNCPSLEGLSVCDSGELVTLRVIGPFPSLKLLELFSCTALESVEIRDVEVPLNYSGRNVKIVVENARWLEMLNIEMYSPEDCTSIIRHQFLNLKQLVVKYYPRNCLQSLLPLANIIGAAPHLEKFAVDAWVMGCCCKRRIEAKEKKNLYGKLKEVRLAAYCGLPCQLELVMHLVENAAALQKITIRTYSPEDEAKARAHQQLAVLVPDSIILEIVF